MRLIDVDAITEDERQVHGFVHDFDLQELLDAQPTITTKQVKYYDEDEKVWKIGSVIVDETD